jgi:hypothetical protein
MGSSGGGGGSTVQPAPSYQLANQPWADYSASTGINTLNPVNTPGLVDLFNQTYGSIGNIAGGGVSSTGFDPAAPIQAGQNVLRAAAGLPNMAQNVWDFGQVLPAMAGQIYQSGFDPQGQMFNSLQQQVTDQTRAALAGSGLGDSPYGAGVLGTNLGNLDINWQNNLLNRQTQAAQSINAIQQQYGTDATTAAQIAKDYGQLNQAGVGLEMLGPEFQLQVGEGLQGMYGAVLGQIQQQISDWLAYLSQGNQNQQSSVSTAAEMNQANQAAQASQGGGGGLGMAGQLMGGMLGK